MNQLVEVKTKQPAQWQSYISTSLRKTAEATLSTAKRIAEYKASTDDDMFVKTMREWFGMSPAHLSYWSKINEALPRFEANINVLPASTRTLYELSSIDDMLWDEFIESGDINHSLTVEGAKSLKVSGGVKKAIAAKYADADNYLEIMQQFDIIRETAASIKDAKKALTKWLKDNPAQFVPSEPEESYYPDQNGPEESYYPDQNEPEESATKVAPKVIPATSEALRTKCLAMFGIYVDKPIVDKDFLTFLDRQAGSDEAKLAAIETLESE